MKSYPITYSATCLILNNNVFSINVYDLSLSTDCYTNIPLCIYALTHKSVHKNVFDAY